MRSRTTCLALPSVICGTILVVLLRVPASAGTARLGQPTDACFSTDKTLRLQIRISEAKRKPQSVRYYKSAARCRKKEAGNPPVLFP